MGVIWSDLEALTVSLAAAFWTFEVYQEGIAVHQRAKHYNSPVWKVQRQR